ncbi:MAG: EAL domain-containing protein [Sulfuricellaceae bacterium]|nr:EAL domain-containing protein [Sulfuricellaceae bacterium]
MKRFSPSRSLRFKLVLASVVVELAMLTLLVANSVRVMQAHLLDQAEIRMEEVRPLLNASLASALAERDYGTLDGVLKQVRREQGIRYLVLYDNAGKSVSSDGWPEGKPLPPLDANIGLAEASGVYDTEIPIQIAGQDYGRLRLGISTRFLSDAKSSILRQSLAIAAIEILLSIALLAGVGYWLTRHLAMLTRASERVAGGHFDVQVPVGGEDEIASLGAAFNTMTAAVRARVGELEASEGMQRRYRTEAEQERARLVSLLGAMNQGILFVGADNAVVYFNPAFLRMWMITESGNLVGKPASEVLTLSANVLAQPDHFSRFLLDVTTTHEVSENFEIHMADGRVVTQISYPVRDPEHRLIGRLWVYEDITKARQTAEQLIYLAERDSLTGLYNRRRFQEELDRFITDADRRKSQGALLFFDLDEFKYVNDSFGHGAGDAMLIRIAGEVGKLVRRNEIFSRLGGDEFAILMPEAGRPEIEALAERVVRAVAQIPFRFDAQNLRLTTSLGIALYPQSAANGEELIAHADAAMYQAKGAGKNAWRVYRSDIDPSQAMVTRLSWNDRISHALENNLLTLHFQGVFRSDNRQSLAHLEVLVRILDVDTPGGFILPGHFIPFAEKSGKILDIDKWVIRTSIALLASSPDVPSLAVNISGRSFDEPTLPQYISDLLAQNGVEPSRLLVELTETSAVTDLHDAQRFIEALRQTGCTVCLDDFGTGFSSFAYLKHLNADILKIDGLFIRDLVNNHDNQVFVKAIVDVARGLHKTTVAEFVENGETLEMLKLFGVDLVQGYHLDMPCADHPALVH